MKKTITYLVMALTSFLPQYIFAQTLKKSIIKSFSPKAIEVKSQEGFIHPGISLSAGDLNRIQKMVRLGYEPWATAFDDFSSASKASKNYIIKNIDKKGNPKYEEMGDGNGQYEARQDADAAYAQTLMWYITGDDDYSHKALKIIRSWYTSLKRKTGDMLTAGMVMQKFCFAAEVLRYTPKSGWMDTDTKGFTDFTAIMLPSTDRPTAFMNQGGIATMGYMSIAIFNNKKEQYITAIKRATIGNESQAPNRDYSLKNQIREVTDSVSGKSVMVLVEMGRDQGHAQGDVGALGSLVQTAYVQNTKVNSNGDIVTDGTGVNLFRFLNNRLLTGAEIVAKYNLGYDIAYPPTEVGTERKPETYFMVSSEGRGALAAVYELIYNYYRYKENMPDVSGALKYINEVRKFNKTESGSQDFLGNGTLLFTNEKAIQNARKPNGPPTVLEILDYEAKIKDKNRIQASSFSGTRGDKTGNIGTEDYTDSYGTRPIISGVKTNFYAWYNNIDFGNIPVDKMLLSAGSSSSKGCKIDVILLDKVAGIDYENVTTENLNEGEKIGTVQTIATGWWTNFKVVKTILNRKISGRHALALRFYDSDNVYRFQANVDWFKFVQTFENEIDLKPKQEFKSLKAEKASIVYKGKATIGKDYIKLDAVAQGTTIVFPFVEFRFGPNTASFKIKSTGKATLSLKNISKSTKLSDSPFLVLNIDNTKNKWKYISVPIDKKITGNQMLYLTVTGGGAKVEFEEMQFDPINQ